MPTRKIMSKFTIKNQNFKLDYFLECLGKESALGAIGGGESVALIKSLI